MTADTCSAETPGGTHVLDSAAFGPAEGPQHDAAWSVLVGNSPGLQQDALLFNSGAAPPWRAILAYVSRTDALMSSWLLFSILFPFGLINYRPIEPKRLNRGSLALLWLIRLLGGGPAHLFHHCATVK